MDNRNQTAVTEFILIGFSHDLETEILLFVLFLSMYVVTLFANLILICAVVWNPKMHTPMYYFLCNLSFLDLFYSSSTVPKMLVDLITAHGRISFVGCMAQMFTSLILGLTECILLAVMAFDRYVAICDPLHYMVIMSWKRCNTITVTVWLASLFLVTFPFLCKPMLFCNKNKINHFICEILAVLKLSCGNTFFFETIIFYTSLFTTFAPFVFIVVSYINIIISVLKIHSADGRSKAFSTCSSHLIVVLMFYGTSMTTYLGPTNQFSSNQQKYFTIIYAVVTPMLNPLIYSLRNNEVKVTTRKLLHKSFTAWLF